MKTNIFIVFFCLLICSVPIRAQVPCPYSLSKKTDIAIGSSILLGATSLLFIQKDATPLTESEINALDASTISSFDRIATTKYSQKFGLVSDILAGTSFVLSVGIPAIASFSEYDDQNSFWSHSLPLAGMWLEMNSLVYVGNEIVKSSVQRTRPFVYNPEVELSEKITLDARKSFFSMHTAFTTANSFFAAKVLSDYYPNSWLKYPMWSVAAILPAAVAYMRVESGNHFPTDIIVGYVYGALCGYAIPLIHSKTKSNSNSAVNTTPLGVSFTYSF